MNKLILSIILFFGMWGLAICTTSCSVGEDENLEIIQNENGVTKVPYETRGFTNPSVQIHTVEHDGIIYHVFENGSDGGLFAIKVNDVKGESNE